MKEKYKRLAYKSKLFGLCCGLLLVLVIVCNVGVSDSKLIAKEYKIKRDTISSIRIVHLTDLHSDEHGQNNANLISLVKAQSPDLIVMTGDMVSDTDDNADVVLNLIKELKDIAPIYYSYGNHEKAWEPEQIEKLEEELEEAGAIVLDNKYEDITINGEEIRVGGYYGYYRQPRMLTDSREEQLEEILWCDEFEDTERLKVLLCHIPTSWVDWGYIDEYSVDIVLSGHYHGGQVKLPLIGGVYAPYVGFFPEYTDGIFKGERATCVLSAGLGSSEFIPRINNPAEVVVVDIVPEEQK